MGGIPSEAQHVKVVVGFNHEIVGLFHIMSRTRLHFPEVGGQHEPSGVEPYRESHVVGSVMWHIKCGDFKVPDSERYFLEYRVMVFAYAFGDACAPQDARHNAVCAEEPYVLVASEDAVCIPHVVGMVVGEEDRFYHRHFDSVGRQHAFHLVCLHSRVNEYSSTACA